MQNYNSTSYIDNTKIINIKSEILCREAEDDFFYFNNVSAAYKKLKEAVKLTPYHIKSLSLLADICFIKGFTKKAFILYKRLDEICKKNPKVISSIANCYYVLHDYDNALTYCEKALDLINGENYNLYSQIIEIEINILIEKKDYKKAYITFIKAQNLIDKTSLNMIYNINYKILTDKINLQKKLQHSNLKII